MNETPAAPPARTVSIRLRVTKGGAVYPTHPQAPLGPDERGYVCAVDGAPAGDTPSLIACQFRRVAIPDMGDGDCWRIDWARIADLPAGAIARPAPPKAA